MKIFLFFILSAIALNCQAQVSYYSSSDNAEKPVYEVEDLSSYEIKMFNEWTKEGVSPDYALLILNAARSQDNLIAAPALIIRPHFFGQVTEMDSIPKAIGAANIGIDLINSTVKTIKEITFYFIFFNNDTPVYDIKTGGKYCILTFSNLTGRTSSNLYNKITDSVLDTYHTLTINSATSKKLFYNKKATTCRLEKIRVKYTNGTSSSKWTVFETYGNESLFADGPLAPMVKYLDRQQEQKKNVETKSTEAYASAEQMPQFPGGDAALLKYISSHLQYPAVAQVSGTQGRVVLQFIVKKNGSIGEVKVARSLSPECDQEAIRVVKSLPMFTPGRKNGVAVDVWYTLPVTFRLQQ